MSNHCSQDFPYSLEEGIEHHVLWSSAPLSTAEMEAEVSRHRDGYEYLIFVNPDVLKSIPTIWHAHVLSRRPPGPNVQGDPQKV